MTQIRENEHVFSGPRLNVDDTGSAVSQARCLQVLKHQPASKLLIKM